MGKVELINPLILEYFLSRIQGRVSGQIIEASAINNQETACVLDVVSSFINSQKAIKNTMLAGNKYSIIGIYLKKWIDEKRHWFPKG